MRSNEEINITNLKQYLLGNLAPSESEAIDLQIISDANLEDELYWAESELMEDYLDETLSPSEVKMFDENFLISAERKAQLRQILIMRNYARKAQAKDVFEKVSEKEPKTFFENLKTFFSVNPRPAIAAFTLVVVGIFATVIFYYTINNQTALEREFAQLNQSELSNLGEFKNIYVINLVNGNFRDSSGTTNKVQLDKVGDKILFRLALPITAATTETFKVELVKDQKVVFTQTKLQLYNNSNGQELRLFLPKLHLNKGEYQINVSQSTAEGSVFTYNLAVE